MQEKKMRRKINISLLFASISFVLTLVLANVNWEFSDYKYSTSFLSVTSATAAKEPVGKIIVAKKEDNQKDREDNDENDVEDSDGNPYNGTPRNPFTDGIEIIYPNSKSPINTLTPKISWEAVEGITNYSVTIEHMRGSEKRRVVRLTNQSAKVINYQVKQTLTPGRYLLTVEAITESKTKPKPGKVIFEVLKTTGNKKKMQN